VLLVTSTTVTTPRPRHVAVALALSLLRMTAGRWLFASLLPTGFGSTLHFLECWVAQHMHGALQTRCPRRFYYKGFGLCSGEPLPSPGDVSDVVCFKTMWAGLLGCPASWHCFSPRDMPLKLKRSRHIAVAIPIVAIGGVVAIGSCQQCAQPQQPYSADNRSVVGWRVRQPGDRGLGFGHITVGPAIRCATSHRRRRPRYRCGSGCARSGWHADRRSADRRISSGIRCHRARGR